MACCNPIILRLVFLLTLILTILATLFVVFMFEPNWFFLSVMLLSEALCFCRFYYYVIHRSDGNPDVPFCVIFSTISKRIQALESQAQNSGFAARVLPVAILSSIIIVFALYVPVWIAALRVGLLSDDNYFLGTFTWPACLTSAQVYHYIPLFNTIVYLMGRWFGWNALPFHIVGLVIQMINVFLVAKLGFELTRSRIAGILSALLFLTFPFAHEVVFWATAQYSYGLMTICFLIGCLIVAKGARDGFTIKTSIAVVTVFIVGVAIIESMLVSFPIWMLLWWQLRPLKKRISQAEAAAFLGLACAAITDLLAKHFLTQQMGVTNCPIYYRLMNFSAMQFHMLRMDALSSGESMKEYYGVAGCLIGLVLLRYQRLIGILILSTELALMPSAILSGVAPRYLYMPASMSSILLAILLYSMVTTTRRLTRLQLPYICAFLAMCLLSVHICVNGIGFLSNQSKYWIAASEISNKMLNDCLAEIRQMPVPEAIAITHVPDRVDGVWFDGAYMGRNGVPEWLHHNLGDRYKNIPIYAFPRENQCREADLVIKCKPAPSYCALN